MEGEGRAPRGPASPTLSLQLDGPPKETMSPIRPAFMSLTYDGRLPWRRRSDTGHLARGAAQWFCCREALSLPPVSLGSLPFPHPAFPLPFFFRRLTLFSILPWLLLLSSSLRPLLWLSSGRGYEIH